MLSGISHAVLTGGPSDNRFTVSGWSGQATITGGGGTDTILSVNDADFTLTDALLTRSTGGTFQLVGIDRAQLTGGPGDNTFTVSGWTYDATLTGGGGIDTVVSTNNEDFALDNSLLVRSDGAQIVLSGILVAVLTGGLSDNTFDISGWDGGGTVTGGGGTDCLVDSEGQDFTLSDDEVSGSKGLAMHSSASQGPRLPAAQVIPRSPSAVGPVPHRLPAAAETIPSSPATMPVSR